MRVSPSIVPCIVIVSVLAVASCAVAGTARAAAKPAACVLSPGPTATVVRIIDGETLGLDDGSEVRLIGALAPRAFDVGAEAGAWPPENEAIAFLRRLTLGRSVQLAFGGRRADRYGRRMAHAFVLDGARREWVQGAMLEAGMARSYGLPESFQCARELDAHEAQARPARRGLWSSTAYRARRADRPAALMRLRFRYARVEGVVRSVTATRAAVYVNFGVEWRRDFTARLLKAVDKQHAGLKEMLMALNNRRVAVRGWIDRNNGPMIEIDDPSQIVVIDEDREADRQGLPEGQLGPSRADDGNDNDSDNDNDDADAGLDNGDSLKQHRPEPSETEPGGVRL